MKYDHHPCGKDAAHTPHDVTAGVVFDGWVVWCPGIMPVWPCADAFEGQLHAEHLVSESFLCPGTPYPPTDITGPWYPMPVSN